MHTPPVGTGTLHLWSVMHSSMDSGFSELVKELLLFLFTAATLLLLLQQKALPFLLPLPLPVRQQLVGTQQKSTFP